MTLSNRIISFTAILCLLSALLVPAYSGKMPPPTIKGPTNPAAGEVVTYYHEGRHVDGPSWSVPSSTGSIVESWEVGDVYYVTVIWSALGFTQLKFYEYDVQLTILSVNVGNALTPPDPGLTFSFDYGCGSTSVTKATGGVKYSYYWQDSPTGTSTASGGATLYFSSPTYGKYVRTRSNYPPYPWSVNAQSTGYIDVNPVPSLPSGTGGSRCNTGSVSLSASPGANGNAVRWYDAPGGGNLLASSTSFVTPSISTTTTYYISSYNTSTGCESGRTAIQAIVYAPSAPSVSGGSNCPGNSVTLNASPGSGGNDIRWYTASSGGSSVGAGGSYVTPALSSSTTYYAATFNTTNGCESVSRTAVTATINPTPSIPGVSNVSRCGPGAVSFTGSPGGNGNTLRWYNAPSGGTLLASGPSYTTPVLSQSTAYYVSSYNTGTGCEGSRIAVTAVINPLPAAPTVSGTVRMGSGTFTLTASVAGASSYKWYSTANTLLQNGPSYTTPVISTSQNNYLYVVPVTSAGCEGAATWVSLSIYPVPVITASAPLVVLNKPVTLDAGAGYDSYLWKNASNATVGNSRTLTTTQPSTYTVTVTKNGVAGSGTSGGYNLRTQMEGVNQNYILANTIKKPGIKEEAGIEALTVAFNSQMVAYFDGLGRALQTVVTQASPTGNDIVQPVSYDGYGRQNLKYVPYMAEESTGHYKALTFTATGDYTHDFFDHANTVIAKDDRPFSEVRYEASPLNRPLKEYGPGDAWGPDASNKYVEHRYPGYDHSLESVIAWKINTAGMPVRADVAADQVEPGGYYSYGQLRIKSVKDEHGREIREYTDRRGNVILKKVQAVDVAALNNPGHWAHTYYIYDAQNNLRYVLQPELGNIIHQYNTYNPSATDLDRFAFRYTFDGLGRLITRQMPGAAPVYMIYDNRDRLVLSQDGSQRDGKNEWTFTKYDALNRPVLTGIMDMGSQTVEALRTAVKNVSVFSESRGTAVHGYTNAAYPQVTDESKYLTVTYYDDYNFLSAWGAVYAYRYEPEPLSQVVGDITYQQPQTQFASVAGQVTGMKVKILDGSATWLKTVNYYDDKYRIVQQIADHHRNGQDRVTSLYDFRGKVLKTKTLHDNDTIYRRFEYDHADRLIKAWHKINQGPEIQLQQSDYNALGQLVTKKLHVTGVSDSRQQLDYRYNIRGWLTRMNNSDLHKENLSDASEPGDYFGMNLAYNEALEGVTNVPQFNGNISAMKWSTNLGLGFNNEEQEIFEATERAYKFTYDPMNRLLAADYSEKTIAWNATAAFSEYGLQYDLNGNVKAVSRNGSAGANIDVLNYEYEGNQLKKITDNGMDEVGFKDGVNTGNDYDYNNNGNMTADRNKDVQSVLYNHLNLPEKVTKTTGDYIVYAYDATGRKLKQTVYNAAHVQQKETDYWGAFLYENDALKFIYHEEGMVAMTGAAPEYQYVLKDHLGNVRIRFTTQPNTETFKATLETNTEASEQNNFGNYASTTNDLLDHTDGGSVYDKALVLNGGYNGQVGLSRSFAVAPGDVINAQVYAKYIGSTGGAGALTDFAAALTGAFGLNSGMPGEMGNAFQAINGFGGWISDGDRPDDDNQPKGFLTILVFDKAYNLVNMSFQQLDGSYVQSGAVKTPHQLLTAQVEVREPGYAYVFLSNEGASEQQIGFDDYEITHTHSAVIQGDEYYPFGGTFNSYSATGSLPDKHLYQSKEWMDDLNIDLYDFGWRHYDPFTLRTTTMDPAGDKFHPLSPYSWAANNPLTIVDPDGREIINSAFGTMYTEQDAQDIFKQLKPDLERSLNQSNNHQTELSFSAEFSKWRREKRDEERGDGQVQQGSFNVLHAILTINGVAAAGVEYNGQTSSGRMWELLTAESEMVRDINNNSVGDPRPGNGLNALVKRLKGENGTRIPNSLVRWLKEKDFRDALGEHTDEFWFKFRQGKGAIFHQSTNEALHEGQMYSVSEYRFTASYSIFTGKNNPPIQIGIKFHISVYSPIAPAPTTNFTNTYINSLGQH